MSNKEGIDHLLTLVTEKTKSTVQRALAWAKKYEKHKECEYSSCQTAVVVFLYESIEPDMFWEIGEALCKMVSSDLNITVKWIRENFMFKKEAVYAAFKNWIRRGTSVGDDFAYSMNKTYEIMQEAAINSDKDLIEWLLSRGVEVDCRDASRNTALHIAAAEGHLEIVDFLFKRGASLFVLNSESQRPFDLALSSRNFEVCDYLFRAGVKNIISESRFLDVIQEGDILKLQYLLERTSSSFIKNGLLLAVESGHTLIVDLLLRYFTAHMTTIEFDKRVLTAALDNGNRDIIEKLLAAGFQMDDLLIAELRKQNVDDHFNFLVQNLNIDTVD